MSASGHGEDADIRIGDLEALFDDLPLPHPDLSSAVRPAKIVEKPDEGPVSKAMGVVFCFAFLVCLPTAIALTIANGLWWPVVAVGVVMVVSATVGAATDKSQIED